MLNRLIEEFELKHSWCTDGVYNYKNDNLYVQFIEPHSGTNWKYCIRADFPETFDRWGVALFEEDFEETDFETVLEKLREFINNKDNIVNEELGS